MDKLSTVLRICFGCILIANISKGDGDILPQKCGEASIYRIFGGIDTRIDEYPWMALIEYRTTDGSMKLGCGAALISKRYLVTAAHCVVGKVLQTIGTPEKVRLGEYDTSKTLDCTLPIEIILDCTDPIVQKSIEKIVAHPEFKPNDTESKMRNDIALLRMAEDVQFSDFIAPICLPSKDIVLQPNFTSILLEVVGWGSLDPNNADSKKRVFHVNLIDFDSCRRHSEDLKSTLSIWNKQLCAETTRKGPCIGDSGGPLIRFDRKNELIGVMSYGPTFCNDQSRPTIYTNVFSYVDWIKSQMTI